MGQRFYEHLNRSLLIRPRLALLLIWCNRLVTAAVFAAYPLLILSRFFLGQPILIILSLILVPAAAFVMLTLLRDRINAPRPYELYQVVALNKKDTRGKSFPSRHVFSCFLVGMTFFAAGVPLGGWLVLAAAVVLAILRVLLGVHFIRDVLAGAFFGLIAGLAMIIVILLLS